MLGSVYLASSPVRSQYFLAGSRDGGASMPVYLFHQHAQPKPQPVQAAGSRWTVPVSRDGGCGVVLNVGVSIGILS